MNKTLAEKILANKSGTDCHAGDIVISQVDLSFVQDTTGPLTLRLFEESGFQKLKNPSQVIMFLDHAAPSPIKAFSNDHLFMRRFAEEKGARIYEVGDGICHQLVAENYANPGDVILDPFFGTGTTGVVSEHLGRHWIGIDEDEDYVNLAMDRIEAMGDD